MPANYRLSEEEYGRGFGGGSYGDGGAIASQINRGTDQIREDLARGGESLANAQRNYYQNLAGAIDKGIQGYEHGQDIATKQEERARAQTREQREAKRAQTEEEVARQNMDMTAAQLGEMKRQAKASERKEAFDTGIDPKTGKTREEMTWQMPFDKFDLEKKTSEEQILNNKENRRIAGAQLKLQQDQDARAVALAKNEAENKKFAANAQAQILAAPQENMEVVGNKIIASTPPERRAAVIEAIGTAKANRFAQTLAQNSTPEGQIKTNLFKSTYSALSDASELEGKLATFERNRTAGGIETPFGELGSGMRNDVANNALQEIASTIAADGTPQSQELAKKLTSPYRFDQSVINDVKGYIAAKKAEAKNYANRASSFFVAGEKDAFNKAISHLVGGVGGDKNRPTSKGLTNQQAGAFLTGASPDLQQEAGVTPQPVSMPAPAPQGAPAPQQGMQPGVPAGGQASPMPAPPKISPLRSKYGSRK